ncbi:XRE family transcriptional regulator [Desulfosporosinus sp. HMP52]|uniref:helix-turn-helix domain-containing protein n=1 Tax=Desulfosporosinus sp. HMP52 TaxID=1487923 RepID=UPI00051FE05C|nr:helix-turn-helix domain-containing protein [Desulfosporosinus sp. HMP52]KGK91485.1 XRE family transcriptional regulator [Desulfosporosinus sp. HMP52]
MRKWLRNVRKSKNFTQEKVAAQASLSRAFYTQIEQGTRNPSFDAASNIARVLGFNPSAFFIQDISEPFVIAMGNSDIIIAHVDKELRYTWIFNPHPDFNSNLVLSKTDIELSDNHGTRKLMELKKSVIETGKKIKKKISFPLSDGNHSYFVFAEPLVDVNGIIIGCVTASMDISELMLES